VTGIAIGEPQDIGRRRDTALNRIGHFVETHQIHVRHREAHRRHARAGDKAGPKTGLLDAGGRLAYLGGNGFYWRIATPSFPMSSRCGVPRAASVPGRPSRASITTHSTAPMAGSGVATGDRHKSFAGSDIEGSYYRRLPAAADGRVAWIFTDIDDEIIGDFGLSGGGAAGFELDRADPELGTPPNAIILARSEEHQRHFVVVPEELLTH
jgi:N,N-dimethylformamidase